MKKRYTQADKLIYASYNYREYYNKGRGLESRLLSSNYNYFEISYNGVNVAYLLENQEFYQYPILILTLEKFMLPERVRQSLVNSAQKNGIVIAYITNIDTGFGITEKPKTLAQQKQILNKIAKYSNDSDVQTAALIGVSYSTDTYYIEAKLYSYNQFVSGQYEILHAEAVLISANKLLMQIMSYHCNCCISLLEPCYNCLQEIITINIKNIIYFIEHKSKWNTQEYIQLVNDLFNKQIKTKGGIPIQYHKEDI